MSTDEELLTQYTTRLAAVKLTTHTPLKSLQIALSNPPITTKNLEIKDDNCTLVAGVLYSIPDSEIDSISSKLSSTELDILMKYVYKLLSNKDDCAKSAVLFRWHGRIVEVGGGLGSIVRVMTDRKTV